MARDEGRRPLATSSLAVGRFAAKKGSLRSPSGRLVASLQVCESFKMSYRMKVMLKRPFTTGYFLWHFKGQQLFSGLFLMGPFPCLINLWFGKVKKINALGVT